MRLHGVVGKLSVEGVRGKRQVEGEGEGLGLGQISSGEGGGEEREWLRWGGGEDLHGRVGWNWAVETTGHLHHTML